MSESSPDRLTVKADGRIELTLGGEKCVLRRAVIGEQWRFEDAFVELQEAEQRDVEWGLSVLGADSEILTAEKPSAKAVLKATLAAQPAEAWKRQKARHQQLLAWWRLVFTTLAPEDFVVPPDDELPPFLLSFQVVNEVRTAWAENPVVPGDV